MFDIPEFGLILYSLSIKNKTKQSVLCSSNFISFILIYYIGLNFCSYYRQLLHKKGHNITFAG